jgi:hypothetical protein
MEAPPSPLSSRPERSGAEGPAVSSLTSEDAVTGGVPPDEGSPPLVVAGVVALVLASLAVQDVAQQPVAVAELPVVPAAVPADSAAAPDASEPVAPVVPADAGALAAAGASVVLAVPALWAWLGVPADLDASAEQVAPGERGALVVLVAPAELGAPVEEAAVPESASVEEPAGRCVLPVPAFLLDPAVMVDD